MGRGNAFTSPTYNKDKYSLKEKLSDVRKRNKLIKSTSICLTGPLNQIALFCSERKCPPFSIELYWVLKCPLDMQTIDMMLCQHGVSHSESYSMTAQYLQQNNTDSYHNNKSRVYNWSMPPFAILDLYPSTSF